MATATPSPVWQLHPIIGTDGINNTRLTFMDAGGGAGREIAEAASALVRREMQAAKDAFLDAPVATRAYSLRRQLAEHKKDLAAAREAAAELEARHRAALEGPPDKLAAVEADRADVELRLAKLVNRDPLLQQLAADAEKECSEQLLKALEAARRELSARLMAEADDATREFEAAAAPALAEMLSARAAHAASHSLFLIQSLQSW